MVRLISMVQIVLVFTQQDLNFTADRDINLTAGQDINLVSNKIRTSSHDSTSMITGTQFSLNSGKDININTNEDLILYANQNGMMIAVEKQNIHRRIQSLGSTTGIGIEGHNEVKITTDGNYHMKALGNSFINTEGEIHQTSALKTTMKSGNTMDLKSVANMKLQSDNQLSMRSGTDMLIYSMGNNIDIPNIISLEPRSQQRQLYPILYCRSHPLEIALKASSCNSNTNLGLSMNIMIPKVYTRFNKSRCRLALKLTPSVHPIHPNRTAGGMVVGSGNQPNAYNSSGAPEGSARFDPIAAANIPSIPNPKK